MPPKCNERRSAIILLRRKGNYVLQKEKNIWKPARKPISSETAINEETYMVCVNCFGLIKNSYYWRHRKICKLKDERCSKKRNHNYRSESQTFLVATGLLGNFLNKSRILEVCNIMRADKIGFSAKSDFLICLYGESLLGKHKRQQMKIAISQKMRNMARLKLVLQKSTTIQNFVDILKPEMYLHIVAGVKVISGYDESALSFKSPSVALHMGTELKFICEVAKKAIITKNPLFKNIDDRKTKVEEISDLCQTISAHWCNDVSSLANKVLNEKKVIKPKLLPTTEDVRAFNLYTSTLASEAYKNLTDGKRVTDNYQTLAQCTLALLLTFNRKRIGEIQFLDMETYERSISAVNQEEVLSCLTEFEKAMSTSFKRVVVFGKGSKQVPVLFTKQLQIYTDYLIHIRKTTDIVPKSNKYIFANAGSDRWMVGGPVIRKFAKNCGAKNPELLTSTKFRKQIATILQIMCLDKDEIQQIAKFLGHTEKTHMEFYRYSFYLILIYFKLTCISTLWQSLCL